MKKNGFTLIELLGVIALLLIITLLVLPNVTGLLKSSGKKEDKVMSEMIYDAAKLYISNNDGKYKKNDGNTYCINLSTLVNEGYLKSPITFSNSDTDITNLKTIEAKYNNGFDYVLKESGDCIEISTGCIVESGDLDTIGSEVRCGSEYFYVIASDNSTLSLLSKYNLNIGNDIYTSMESGIQSQYVLGYKDGYETYGGINIKNMDYYLIYYKNYIENKNSININSISLLTLEEAQSLTSFDWLYLTSYWLSTLNSTEEICTYGDFYDCVLAYNTESYYHVSSQRRIDNTIYMGGYLNSESNAEVYAFGIRPVIKINKTEIN